MNIDTTQIMDKKINFADATYKAICQTTYCTTEDYVTDWATLRAIFWATNDATLWEIYQASDNFLNNL